MVPAELEKWRAEVIERAINAEWLMSAIICQHYFKAVYLPFLLEVLYDEQFSFALKRRVLEKIVDHPDLPRRFQELNRLGTIRNYFAHCGQELCSIGEPRGYVPDPRKPSQAVDFAAMHAEFLEMLPRVEAFLLEVFRGKGGQVSDQPYPPAQQALPDGRR